MARTSTKKSMSKTITKVTAPVDVEVVEDTAVTEGNVSEIKKPDPKKKAYDKEGLIDCRSITNGLLVYEGDRSKRVYRWGDYGDVEQVEYQDLVYMITSRKPIINTPRIIIEDDEFIAQYPQVENMYNEMYSYGDFVQILNLPVVKMKNAIVNLPAGAKEAVKSLASNMIDQGQIDSVAKIKAIDEIFGTELLITLATA